MCDVCEYLMGIKRKRLDLVICLRRFAAYPSISSCKLTSLASLIRWRGSQVFNLCGGVPKATDVIGSLVLHSVVTIFTLRGENTFL